MSVPSKEARLMSRVKGGLCLRITRSREQERHSRGTRTPATRVPKGHSQSRSRSGSLGRDASTPGRCTGGAHSCSAADRASQAKRSEPAAGEAAPGGRGPGHARPPPQGATERPGTGRRTAVPGRGVSAALDQGARSPQPLRAGRRGGAGAVPGPPTPTAPGPPRRT